jgi:hypothetical protein
VFRVLTGWRIFVRLGIKFTNICQPMHILASMNYFDSDMSKSTNTVVYFAWKRVIYIYVCGQCRTQFMLPNMYFYDGKVSHIYFYDGKVSRIDGASVTMILCLHVLITRRILLILDMMTIFSEYRCLKR